jgi:hypothetical protein
VAVSTATYKYEIPAIAEFGYDLEFLGALGGFVAARNASLVILGDGPSSLLQHFPQFF